MAHAPGAHAEFERSYPTVEQARDSLVARDPLEDLFRGRLLITMQEAAAAMTMTVRTLRVHIAAGRIQSTPIGAGTRRTHRAFTREQIKSFLDACASVTTERAIQHSMRLDDHLLRQLKRHRRS